VNILKEMLLIEDLSIIKLNNEFLKMTGLFVAPLFILALALEFIGELDFIKVIKRLIVILIVMGFFYTLHTKSVDLSLEVAAKTLKHVSPNNLFLKRWNQQKLKTKTKKSWGYLEALAIPNLNDLLATGFYLFSKVFILLLKLIYSSVYHLTYLFSGFTALMYFFGWTEKSLIGSFQSTLWCILMPFVIISILALVGNTINAHALSGTLAIASIETILWLFGITLILLLTPLITWSMVKGDGIAAAGSKIGMMAAGAGFKATSSIPIVYSLSQSAKRRSGRLMRKTINGGANLINRGSEVLNKNNLSRGNSKSFVPQNNFEAAKERSNKLKANLFKEKYKSGTNTNNNNSSNNSSKSINEKRTNTPYRTSNQSQIKSPATQNGRGETKYKKEIFKKRIIKHKSINRNSNNELRNPKNRKK
jgi:hypothetical protein